MKKETIRLIEFEEIAGNPQTVFYLDNDIAVIDQISPLAEKENEPFKLNCLIINFCIEGEATLSINGHWYILQKDNCAILPPGCILQNSSLNEQCIFRIAIVSQKFLNQHFFTHKETWNILNYLQSNPIFPINAKDSYNMFLYKEMLLTLLKEKMHPYSKQSHRYFFAAMFSEFLGHLSQLIPEEEIAKVSRKRATVIVGEFMRLVATDDGTHRRASYYADRLCYSSKYLSTIVKEATARTPLQIINEHVMKQIKIMLKQSSLSIKEIADYFDFPNASFFGKFVKMHSGMSPLQYRLQGE